MVQPIVSICIPTYGRVEITKNTIQSIYSQNVDEELFEICVSDNSPTSETEDMLKSNFPDKKNLIYSKSTCEGFYNSIEALKLGKGKYLKLHNNYTKFNNGIFMNFLHTIEESEHDDCVVFFTFDSIKQKSYIASYNSFNDFMNKISYLSTWSTSFGIWKKDFDEIYDVIEVDKMFPHTSVLFSQVAKRKYYIDNNSYFENQDVGKKGGYNLPDTFGTRYLDMVQKLYEKQYISIETFTQIKKDILRFIANWYVTIKIYTEKYTFSFENWENTINSLYGKKGVNYIRLYYRRNYLLIKIKKLLKNCIRR